MSSFLSASNIFLIVILLGSPTLVFIIVTGAAAFSIRTGALGNTFPVLFQLKGFFIYSDQFVQNSLYVITPQNRCLIFWRLLLSGFRSVLMNTATDKPLRLKIRFVSRDLVPSDRATCTIASGVNFFVSDAPSTLTLITIYLRKQISKTFLLLIVDVL